MCLDTWLSDRVKAALHQNDVIITPWLRLINEWSFHMHITSIVHNHRSTVSFILFILKWIEMVHFPCTNSTSHRMPYFLETVFSLQPQHCFNSMTPAAIFRLKPLLPKTRTRRRPNYKRTRKHHTYTYTIYSHSTHTHNAITTNKRAVRQTYCSRTGRYITTERQITSWHTQRFTRRLVGFSLSLSVCVFHVEEKQRGIKKLIAHT